jgi:Ca-activated chloride channel homolog
MSDLIGLAFARPAALWLLLLVPFVLLLPRLGSGRRSRSTSRSAWLRIATVALLSLALAEPMLASSQSAATTLFVVDRSQSLDESAADRIDSWLEDTLASAGSGDQGAIIAFGAAPELVAQRESANGLDPDLLAGAEVDSSATNIESALAMARALPLGGSRRIVLISDGAENSGAALQQASQAAADLIPIDVLPIEGIGAGDLRIEAVSAPSSLWLGESTTLLATVATGEAGDGSVEMLVNGSIVASQDVSFPLGISTYTFEIADLEPGFHVLTTRVISRSAPDRYPENNIHQHALIVRDAPRLLLVSQPQTDSSALVAAIEAQGLEVEQREPELLPHRLSELSGYDAIVLNNVPLSAFTASQLSALQETTRELGKGLVVLGGTSSYGPGGYANSQLEELLPVSVKVTEGKERQKVALMLIMDKSGSMAYDPLQTTSKIEMAKEAARQAVGALTEGDEIGILVFNDRQHWVVRLTLIEGPDSRDQINAAIDQLSADGGTEIYPALDVGFDEIVKADADVRHVILLSDGKSRTGTRDSYQMLINDLVARNTTLSTIAIGDDADTDLLQFLAEAGGGNYHATERAEDIPRLTVSEAQSAGSQSIIRGSFVPLQSLPSPMLRGFEPTQLPPISGYNYAEAKPNAQVILTSTRIDPILAKWQYGLGRVVAWTADDGIDFADQWRQWDRYGEFWASVVRWSLPDPETGPFQIEVDRDGSDALVTIRVTGGDDDYVDSASMKASITDGSGIVTAELVPYQSGPGEYQLRVAAPEAGAYSLTIEPSGSGGGRPVTAGFSIPPALEFQANPQASALLAAIAERTGGRVLSLDDPQAVFDAGYPAPSDPLRTYQPLWWAPLSLALMLFILDIGLRMGVLQRLMLARPR